MHWILLLGVLGGDEIGPVEREDIDRMIGVRVAPIYTTFDGGLLIDSSAPGIAFDLRGEFNLHNPTRVFAGIGFMGWQSEDDATGDTVDIAEYRFTAGVELDFRTIDLGLAASTGTMHFHRPGESSNDVMFEFEMSLGYKPSPFLRLSVVGFGTHVYSDFNYKNHHLQHIYSVGFGAEFRF